MSCRSALFPFVDRVGVPLKKKHISVHTAAGRFLVHTALEKHISVHKSIYTTRMYRLNLVE